MSRHAELEVIQAAYKRLAAKYHPDRNPDPSAQRIMRDLNQAYEVLSDANRREETTDAVRNHSGAETGRQKTEQAEPNQQRPRHPPNRRQEQQGNLATISISTFRSAVLRGISAIIVEVQIAQGREGGLTIIGLGRQR